MSTLDIMRRHRISGTRISHQTSGTGVDHDGKRVIYDGEWQFLYASYKPVLETNTGHPFAGDFPRSTFPVFIAQTRSLNMDILPEQEAERSE